MGNLGKIIAAKGFNKLPKFQLIDQSGHTGPETHFAATFFLSWQANIWQISCAKLLCSEIMYSDWLKLVQWLETSNQGALFLSGKVMQLLNLFMTLAPSGLGNSKKT